MELFDYTPGKPLSPSEGYALIEYYLSSGLSSSAFYKQIGMSEKTFYKWRKRYLSDHSGHSSGEQSGCSADRLVPIRLDSGNGQSERCAIPSGYRFEVELSNGIRIRLNSLSQAEDLLELCKLLK